MATNRAVPTLADISDEGATSVSGSKALTKRDSINNQSSNSSKLPPQNSHVQINSSLSSIDSAGAKQNCQSLVSSSHPTETISSSNVQCHGTTSSTSTDTEDDSEQDNDDNGPLKSYNLPKSTLKSIPNSQTVIAPAQTIKDKTTSNSHDRSSRRMKHFQKLFKSVLKDQMPELIDSYVCAYQGDILLQGKMYITDRYLCFHSRIISYVTKHVHPWEQIERVTKERVAFIFPTAIGIKMKNPEKKITYASFLQRDQAFEKILSIWSLYRCDSSSLSNHADDEEQRYASLPTSKLAHLSANNRKTSNDDLYYEAMDQFEQDPVIQLCLPSEKTRANKKKKRRRTEKDEDEDLSTSKKSYRKIPLGNNLVLHEPAMKRQASPNALSNQLSTNNNVDKSAIGRSSILHSRSDSSRDRLHPDLPLRTSSSNHLLSSSSTSSIVTSDSTGFLSDYTRLVLLSFVSLVKQILHYFIFLFNQWKVSPMKISLVLLFFLLILILHSFYLIKLAYRIEHRLQSLHHHWPSTATSSIHKSLPSLK